MRVELVNLCIRDNFHPDNMREKKGLKMDG